MQCVILAAGQGTRLRPLTDTVPKPLVPVAGRPLLDHIAAAVPYEVDEFVIVHGYRGEQIRAHCGAEYFGRPVTYVHQREQLGTGPALWCARPHIRGRFLYLFADDIHGAEDLAAVVAQPRSMLVLSTETPERFGIVTKHTDGTLADIIEKPTTPVGNLASTGVFVFDEHIFAYPPTVETNGEFYHTDIIRAYCKEHPIAVIEQSLWLPVGYPEDIARAESALAALGT